MFRALALMALFDYLALPLRPDFLAWAAGKLMDEAYRIGNAFLFP